MTHKKKERLSEAKAAIKKKMEEKGEEEEEEKLVALWYISLRIRMFKMRPRINA